MAVLELANPSRRVPAESRLHVSAPSCHSRGLTWETEAPPANTLCPSGKASLLGPGWQAASQSHCHSLVTRWRKCAFQLPSPSLERPVTLSMTRSPLLPKPRALALLVPGAVPLRAGGRCRSCLQLCFPWRETLTGLGHRVVHTAVWPAASTQDSARAPPA